LNLLGHRHERHALRIEQFDHPGEVGERAGQPVDFVDHHHLDQPRADVGQQPRKRGPRHPVAGETAVVVGGLDQLPALALLALDKRRAGLALGVERVEILSQTLVRRHGYRLELPRFGGR
jgi:hypothetical protein